ncbi:MAG: CbtB domain-containing protein [Pikeienuella sp.]
MTTTGTIRAASLGSTLVSATFAAFIGFGMLYVSGLAQFGALHDAAHDVRHATGFPCH